MAEQQGPPDLDELLNKLQKKFNAFFGSKKIPGQSKSLLLPIAIGVLLIIWVIAGVYIVSPGEQSVVLRFGKYVKTEGPGMHFIPRFIESRYIVNVQRIANFPYQAEMLTKDENIVSVDMAVQYQISDPRQYLFNAVDPIESLQQATASSLRQVVGDTILDDLLTTGREQVRAEVNRQLSSILAMYNTGIIVTDVTLQPIRPPEAVTEAFDDVNKAREDEQRYVNQAIAYQQKVVPIAEGQASRIIQEASAYKQQITLKAQADTASFSALLPQYLKAPKIMEERLYLETMESVLKNSSLVLAEANTGNITFLPLDKLLKDNVKQVELPSSLKVDNNSAVANSGAASSDSGTMRPSRENGSDEGDEE